MRVVRSRNLAHYCSWCNEQHVKNRFVLKPQCAMAWFTVYRSRFYSIDSSNFIFCKNNKSCQSTMAGGCWYIFINAEIGRRNIKFKNCNSALMWLLVYMKLGQEKQPFAPYRTMFCKFAPRTIRASWMGSDDNAVWSNSSRRLYRWCWGKPAAFFNKIVLDFKSFWLRNIKSYQKIQIADYMIFFSIINIWHT